MLHQEVKDELYDDKQIASTYSNTQRYLSFLCRNENIANLYVLHVFMVLLCCKFLKTIPCLNPTDIYDFALLIIFNFQIEMGKMGPNLKKCHHH